MKLLLIIILVYSRVTFVRCQDLDFAFHEDTTPSGESHNGKDRFEYRVGQQRDLPPQKSKSKSNSDDIDDSEDDYEGGDSRSAVKSEIGGQFSNKQTFACPNVKPQLHTGDDLSNLSPEDIRVVGAMGDSLASGRGLWEGTEVEFRGAAFPIGGDANIDGLVTIPNILSQFHEDIEGVSHGMGTVGRLPDYQYNVAEPNTETEDLPKQAVELVRRLKLHAHYLETKWTLIIIVTGTEEFCGHCDEPNHSSIRRALGVLRKGIPKALVVLLGPVHVASSYEQNINLLKDRCSCLDDISSKRYRNIVKKWKETFISVEEEFNHLNYTTFGVLAIPQLTIHSREPTSLLVPGKPVLNRKGHTYAAKWLWNRLIAGPNYNASEAQFSTDAYYCPSIGCPYFRTVQNFDHCSIMTEDDYQKIVHPTLPPNVTTPVPHHQRIANHMGFVIGLVVVLALISVSIFGTIFYCHGLNATRGRFEIVDEEKQSNPTEEHTPENPPPLVIHSVQRSRSQSVATAGFLGRSSISINGLQGMQRTNSISSSQNPFNQSRIFSQSIGIVRDYNTNQSRYNGSIE
ncbi:hypothetical protein WR25_23567 [Diploscapter pachys]|uniref:SGNH hydrolase-type esterase domain-containing protein n=1 Tax=Diploscapter pachys TaxID=2018661 RepID=A0A2A2JFJ6_9BILA|nr:hypothetical protein WR25_23567 [Diploscapter pachys]